MTVRISTKGCVDLINPSGQFTSVSDGRHVELTDVPANDKTNQSHVVHVAAEIDLGPVAELILHVVPFTDVAEFVDQVRDGDIDGFEDALDHLPPRGRSRKYTDAYTLGQVEARGRAE